MSLADVDEPLVLADGTVINPDNGKPVRNSNAVFVEIPSERVAQKIVAKTRRTLVDLPVAPREGNIFAAIAFYTMFGLADQDIAIALGCTVDDVTRVKSVESYRQLVSEINNNYLADAQEQVRNLLNQNALAAATKIVEHAQSDNDVLSFKASQDILDRAGHRPVDTVNHSIKMEDALRIVVTKSGDTEGITDIKFGE